jgi:hypothetical protein
LLLVCENTILGSNYIKTNYRTNYTLSGNNLYALLHFLIKTKQSKLVLKRQCQHDFLFLAKFASSKKPKLKTNFKNAQF